MGGRAEVRRAGVAVGVLDAIAVGRAPVARGERGDVQHPRADSGQLPIERPDADPAAAVLHEHVGRSELAVDEPCRQ